MVKVMYARGEEPENVGREEGEVIKKEKKKKQKKEEKPLVEGNWTCIYSAEEWHNYLHLASMRRQSVSSLN